MLSLARKSVERESPGPEGAARCRLLPGDDSDSANAKLLQLVGESKRVLALGCPSASLSQALQRQGCQVVSVQEADDEAAGTSTPSNGSLGELVIQGEAETASFDVVLAAGILEQLRDPLAVLVAAKKYLRREGYVVAAVPNVAHGNVRLALLAGRFPAGDVTAFKEAPLRFFTYDSLVGLFEEAEFAIGVVERQEEDISVPAGVAASPELLDSVCQAPEARTALFITVAYPLPWHGLSWLQHRLRSLAEQHAAAKTEADELREDLEAVNGHLRMLVEQQEASIRHEKALRAQVVAVHDQLLRRDEDYRKNSADLQDQVKQTEAWWQAQVKQTEAWWQARVQEAHEQLAQRDQANHYLTAHRDALEARLERLRRTLPGRALKVARQLVSLARRAVGK